MHRRLDDLRQGDGKEEDRKAEGDSDGARIEQHRTQLAPPGPGFPAPRTPPHLLQAPAPDEDVEGGDVDDSVEHALRAEYRVFERHAHEPGVREYGRESEDRKRPRVPPRREPRDRDQRAMHRDGDRERRAEAAEHRGVERTLEHVDEEARRHDEDEHVHHALHRRLVDKAAHAAKRPHRHQGEKDADLRRDCGQILHSAYYTKSARVRGRATFFPTAEARGPQSLV